MNKSKTSKILSIFLSLLLLLQQTGLAQVASSIDLSGKLAALRQSFTPEARYRPLHLRYLSYDSLNNNFKLLVDKGSDKNFRTSDLENASRDLLKYFFIGLALPNDTFWVNLRPDSPDEVIDPLLAQTDIGRILLEADVELKKDTALATSPDTKEGKEYWDRLYQKAGELFGTTEVTIPTLTRPWIVPDEVIISESTDSAYIYKATLKVMLEEDYLKSETNPNFQNSKLYKFEDERAKELNAYSTQLIKELILPKITQSINTGKKYAALRQVYYSLILAQWFKAKHQGQSPSGTVPGLIDSKDLSKLISEIPYSKDTYFKLYQKSFRDGEYKFDISTPMPAGQVIRSYFSGGAQLGAADAVALHIPSNGLVTERASVAGVQATVDSGGDIVNIAAVGAAGQPTGTAEESVGGRDASSKAKGGQQSDPGDDVVLAAGQDHRIYHAMVHRAIQDGRPEELKSFRSLGRKAQGALKNKYRDPDGRIVIPVAGLLEKTGLLAHIGLGTYYEEPVVYIDASLGRGEYRSFRRAVKGHEDYEVKKWEGRREKLNFTHKQMRAWIKKNSKRDGTGYAQELARGWHKEAPSIEHIYRRPEISMRFQQGRVERILKRIRSASPGQNELVREMFKRMTGDDLKRLRDPDISVESTMDRLAESGHKDIRILLSLADELTEDELAWVIGHEFVHIQTRALDEFKEMKNGFLMFLALLVREIEKDPYSKIAMEESLLIPFYKAKTLEDQLELIFKFVLGSKGKLEQLSQGLEQAADFISTALVTLAGYDPRCAVSAHQKIMKKENRFKGLLKMEAVSFKAYNDDETRLGSIRDFINKSELGSPEDIYEEDVVLAAGEEGEAGRAGLIDYGDDIIDEPQPDDLPTFTQQLERRSKELRGEKELPVQPPRKSHYADGQYFSPDTLRKSIEDKGNLIEERRQALEEMRENLLAPDRQLKQWEVREFAHALLMLTRNTRLESELKDKAVQILAEAVASGKRKAESTLKKVISAGGYASENYARARRALGGDPTAKEFAAIWEAHLTQAPGETGNIGTPDASGIYHSDKPLSDETINMKRKILENAGFSPFQISKLFAFGACGNGEESGYRLRPGVLLQFDGKDGVWITGEFDTNKMSLAYELCQADPRWKIVSPETTAFMKVEVSTDGIALIGRRAHDKNEIDLGDAGVRKVDLSGQRSVRVKWVVALDDSQKDFLQDAGRGLSAEEAGARIIKAQGLSAQTVLEKVNRIVAPAAKEEKLPPRREIQVDLTGRPFEFKGVKGIEQGVFELPEHWDEKLFTVAKVIINGKEFKIGSGNYVVVELADGKKVYWGGQHNLSYSFFFEHYKERAAGVVAQKKPCFHIDAHRDMGDFDGKDIQPRQTFDWEQERRVGLGLSEATYFGHMIHNGIVSEYGFYDSVGEVRELAKSGIAGGIMDLDIDVIVGVGNNMLGYESFGKMRNYLVAIAQRSDVCFFTNSSELSRQNLGVPIYIDPQVAVSCNGALIEDLANAAADPNRWPAADWANELIRNAETLIEKERYTGAKIDLEEAIRILSYIVEGGGDENAGPHALKMCEEFKKTIAKAKGLLAGIRGKAAAVRAQKEREDRLTSEFRRLRPKGRPPLIAFEEIMNRFRVSPADLRRALVNQHLHVRHLDTHYLVYDYWRKNGVDVNELYDFKGRDNEKIGLVFLELKEKFLEAKKPVLPDERYYKEARFYLEDSDPEAPTDDDAAVNFWLEHILEDFSLNEWTRVEPLDGEGGAEGGLNQDFENTQEIFETLEAWGAYAKPEEERGSPIPNRSVIDKVKKLKAIVGDNIVNEALALRAIDIAYRTPGEQKRIYELGVIIRKALADRGRDLDLPEDPGRGVLGLSKMRMSLSVAAQGRAEKAEVKKRFELAFNKKPNAREFEAIWKAYRLQVKGESVKLGNKAIDNRYPDMELPDRTRERKIRSLINSGIFSDRQDKRRSELIKKLFDYGVVIRDWDGGSVSAAGQKVRPPLSIEKFAGGMSADVYEILRNGGNDFAGIEKKYNIERLYGGRSGDVVFKAMIKGKEVAIKIFKPSNAENIPLVIEALNKVKGNFLFEQYLAHGLIDGGSSGWIATEFVSGEKFRDEKTGWSRMTMQERGAAIKELGELVRAMPDEHWDQLAEIFRFCKENNIAIDPSPGNYIYDRQKGFTAIDLKAGVNTYSLYYAFVDPCFPLFLTGAAYTGEGGQPVSDIIWERSKQAYARMEQRQRSGKLDNTAGAAERGEKYIPASQGTPAGVSSSKDRLFKAVGSLDSPDKLLKTADLYFYDFTANSLNNLSLNAPETDPGLRELLINTAKDIISGWHDIKGGDSYAYANKDRASPQFSDAARKVIGDILKLRNVHLDYIGQLITKALSSPNNTESVVNALRRFRKDAEDFFTQLEAKAGELGIISDAPGSAAAAARSPITGRLLATVAFAQDPASLLKAAYLYFYDLSGNMSVASVLAYKLSGMAATRIHEAGVNIINAGRSIKGIEYYFPGSSGETAAPPSDADARAGVIYTLSLKDKHLVDLGALIAEVALMTKRDERVSAALDSYKKDVEDFFAQFEAKARQLGVISEASASSGGKDEEVEAVSQKEGPGPDSRDENDKPILEFKKAIDDFISEVRAVGDLSRQKVWYKLGNGSASATFGRWICHEKVDGSDPLGVADNLHALLQSVRLKLKDPSLCKAEILEELPALRKSLFLMEAIAGFDPAKFEYLPPAQGTEDDPLPTKAALLNYFYNAVFAGASGENNLRILREKLARIRSLVDAMESGIKKINFSEDIKQGPPSAGADPTSTPGGIDFRSIPIVTQAMANLSAGAAGISMSQLRRMDLDKEWSDIEQMVSSGIAPSGERIKEYLQASSVKGELDSDVDKVLTCISDILRQDEEKCCSSDETLKDVLIVLEASRSSSELGEILIGTSAI